MSDFQFFGGIITTIVWVGILFLIFDWSWWENHRIFTQTEVLLQTATVMRLVNVGQSRNYTLSDFLVLAE